jgi:hypothetical protein
MTVTRLYPEHDFQSIEEVEKDIGTLEGTHVRLEYYD